MSGGGGSVAAAATVRPGRVGKGWALVALDESSSAEWAAQAAAHLATEWPRTSGEERLARVQDGKSGRSFGLVHVDEGTCVGHGRLQDAADAGEGAGCVVTSVVVDERRRGQGLGARLMRELEAKARELGYTYMYLWTSTARGFYGKLGFAESESVNVAHPIFEAMGEASVSSLEDMLAAKLARTRGGGPAAAAKANTGEVWMRKRLLEAVPSQERSEESVHVDVAAGCAAHDGPTASGGGAGWRYHVAACPWQKQVGPSCGLAALRMILDQEASAGGGGGGGGGGSGTSLLQAAIARGFSEDGEVFNVGHLGALAREVGGLSTAVAEELSAMPDAAARRLVECLAQRQFVVLPYDRGLGNSLPACADGAQAHYCVVLGLCVRDAGVELGRYEASPLRQVVALAQAAALPDVLLVAQHGMGRRLLVAPALQWAESNAQLLFRGAKSRSALERRRFRADDVSLARRALVVVPSAQGLVPPSLSPRSPGEGRSEVRRQNS